MPAPRKDPEAIQRQIGPHFKVVPDSFPVQVQCLVCRHEGSKPFQFKPAAHQAHIASKKHQKNAKTFYPARAPLIPADDIPMAFDGDQDDDEEDDAPGFADDAALPTWYEGESRDAFWMMAEERDDVIAGLEVELAELRREDQEMADAHAAHENPLRHLVGQEAGSWGPFRDKRIFASLSFLLSPRQAHSLQSLEHALGLAEALGAPNVPSINVCKKALARIYLRGKEKLVRSTDVDGNVFWRNSVASLLKEDFCNSAVRPNMHLLPRRTTVVRELRDGGALAYNTDERTVAPMIRLENGKEFWIKEVYEHGQQMVRPQCFFEGEQGEIFGEAKIVRQNGDELQLTEDRLMFRADQLKYDAERRLSRLPLGKFGIEAVALCFRLLDSNILL
ncbi:unnamed protein product [Tilletia controversa]|nr:unnamed protein product [Tilletia controversa]CAD7066405.1 unnamed protein product [Tilletia caries]